MKIIEMLSIALRIFGILIFVKTLKDAPYLFQTLDKLTQLGVNETTIYLQWAYVILSLLISVVMIKYPAVLAHLLSTKSNSNSPLLEEKGQAIQIAGFTIIGVYILSWAIPDLVFNGLTILQLNEPFTPVDQLMAQTKINLLVTLVEIGVGLYLMFGAVGLSKFINKIRS